MRQRLLRDRLPKLGNEDLDSFIQCLEDVALEAEMPKNYWHIYFENCLTGQVLKRYPFCVTREHRANYDTSRDVLLEAMGYSKEEAIHSVFFLKRYISWSVCDTYQRTTFLVKQMLKDVDDAAEYLAKEWTIACHNMECGGFIRTRNPSTPIQLLAALNEYERMYGCAAWKSFRYGQNFDNDHHQTGNGLSIQHHEKRESNQGVKMEKQSLAINEQLLYISQQLVLM